MAVAERHVEPPPLAAIYAPGFVALNPRQWRFCEIIGSCRTRKGDTFRSPSADRGPRNELCDLAGCVGELAASLYLRPKFDLLHSTLFSLYRDPRPDIMIPGERAKWLLAADAKCALWSPNRYRLMVNRETFDAAPRPVIPVVTAHRAPWAYVGKPIPAADVAAWKVERWTSEAYAIPVADLLGSEWGRVREAITEPSVEAHADAMTFAEALGISGGAA